MSTETRSVIVRLRAEADQYKREMRAAQAETDRLTRQMDKGSGSIRKFALAGVGIGAAWKVGDLVKDSIQLEAAYSKTLAQVAAQTKAPAAAMQGLDDLALQLGADTVFSANDAAAAMLALAKGGLTTAQIEAGALQNSLTLAAAGGLELGTAADTVVNAMGAFGLTSKDTGAAVAALAGAANASTAEVSDIAQALSQAGTEAKSAGLSVQETTAILAAFSNAGIQGSDAGTSLRTMLTRLVPQTDEARKEMERLKLSFVDTNGEFVSAQEIAGRLATAYKGMSAEERTSSLSTVFGADARRAANVLIAEGSEGIKGYIKQTSDLTAAEKLAEAGMSGTAGAIESLSGSIETAMIQFGKGLAPLAQDAAAAAGELVDGADLEEWGRGAATAVSGLAAEVGPLAIDLFEIGRQALPLVQTVGTTTTAALEGLLKVVGPLVDGFSELPDSAQQALVLAAAIGVIDRRTGQLQNSASTAVTRLRDMDSASRNLALRNVALKAGVGAAGVGLLSFADDLGKVDRGLGQTATVLGSAAVGFTAAGPWGAAVGAGVALLQSFGDQSKATREEIERLAPAFEESTGKLNAAMAKQQAVKDLSSGSLIPGGDINALQGAKAIGVDLNVLTDAALGSGVALGQVRERLAEIENMSPEQFRAAADQMGISVADLADIQVGLGDLLEDNAGKWQAAGENARLAAEALLGPIDNAKQFRQALSEIPPAVVTELETMGYDASIVEMDQLIRTYDLTPEQVQTILTALDRATPLADRVADKVRDVDGMEANPRIDVRTGDAISRINTLQRLINGMNGKTVRVAVEGGLGGGITRAEGGPIVGQGGPKQDNILVNGSNGEHMWTAREVENAGGHGAMYAMRAQARAGRRPRYAVGGAIDDAWNESYRAAAVAYPAYSTPSVSAASPTAPVIDVTSLTSLEGVQLRLIGGDVYEIAAGAARTEVRSNERYKAAGRRGR